jgi:hypothetical protein
MLAPALLAALALQNAPAPAPAPPVPPAQRPKLLERSTLRPTRSGEARQNHAQEAAPEPAAQEAAPADARADTAAQDAAAVEAAQQPAPVPAQGAVRIAPSAVAPQAPAASAPAAGAAGARKPFPLGKLVPVAALAVLVGPAIGAIWFLGRVGPPRAAQG